MEYRAHKHNLVMVEGMPFGQYRGDIAIRDMLHPRFFLSIRAMLQAGDSLRLVRVEGGRVAEYADAIVVQVTREAVEVRADGPVHCIPAAAEEKPLPTTAQPASEMYWKKGFGCFQALDGKGGVIAEMPTRADVFALIEEKTGKPPVKWQDEQKAA